MLLSPSRQIKMSNMTIICYTLHLLGPMHESRLTLVLLLLQVAALPAAQSPAARSEPRRWVSRVAGALQGGAHVYAREQCSHVLQPRVPCVCMSPRAQCPPHVQVVCNTAALLVRYQLAGYFYDVVR